MRIRDGKIRIRNPGWKKFGFGINIPDPQPLVRFGKNPVLRIRMFIPDPEARFLSFRISDPGGGRGIIV
jgi:hypothetical protein